MTKLEKPPIAEKIQQSDMNFQQSPMPPTTTLQQDKTLQGQREISQTWETTQAKIALLVVAGGYLMNALVITVVLLVFAFMTDKEITVNQMALLSVSLQSVNLTLGIVIGFYFSRTNHQAIGGIGPKANMDNEYKGR